MRKKKAPASADSSRTMRPALTPEARENQLISLAVDLAEEQLRSGTASSQVITHYLKLGTLRERLERERLENENELLRAKTRTLELGQQTEEAYEKVLAAMQKYRGLGDYDDYC